MVVCVCACVCVCVCVCEREREGERDTVASCLCSVICQSQALVWSWRAVRPGVMVDLSHLSVVLEPFPEISFFPLLNSWFYVGNLKKMADFIVIASDLTDFCWLDCKDESFPQKVEERTRLRIKSAYSLSVSGGISSSEVIWHTVETVCCGVCLYASPVRFITTGTAVWPQSKDSLT